MPASAPPEPASNTLSVIAMDLQFLFFFFFFCLVLPPILILIISSTFKTLMRLWKSSEGRKKPLLNLPPGPLKLPFIGNMHNLIFGHVPPHQTLANLAKKYGPIMQLELGELVTVVISSAETAKEVMKRHDIKFADRPFLLTPSVVTYNYSGIGFAPYGDYWRQMRKICVLELLSTKRVQSFQSIREEETSNLIKSVSASAGFPVNLSKMLCTLTNILISRAAFGNKCKDAQVFVADVQEMLKLTEGFSVADLFPSIKSLQVVTRIKSRIERLFKRTDRILETIITEHRASMEAAEAADGETGGAQDLVHVLLNLQDHGNLQLPLTDDNIKAVILDIFVAGSDTSAITLEWTMAELLKNPRAMEKAQAEVRQAFGGKRLVSTGTGPEALKYLKLVIKETLRLHPPAPLLLPRECREECKIKGYDIPIKTKVMVNAWAIGRDSNYWVEPKKFCPERFSDGSVDFKGTNFEYIPFGAGRRMCPGISFGMATVETILAQLLYHFDWKLPNGMKEEDLDMTEEFGATTRRKMNLQIIPVPYLHIQ